ncbi:MAG: hypothetical protein ABIJ21_06910 [Nanoarchaeota archaeon]
MLRNLLFKENELLILAFVTIIFTILATIPHTQLVGQALTTTPRIITNGPFNTPLNTPYGITGSADIAYPDMTPIVNMSWSVNDSSCIINGSMFWNDPYPQAGKIFAYITCPTEGSRRLTLTATDGAGRSAEAYEHLGVTSSIPPVISTEYPYFASVGVPSPWFGEASDPDGTIASIEWSALYGLCTITQQPAGIGTSHATNTGLAQCSREGNEYAIITVIDNHGAATRKQVIASITHSRGNVTVPGTGVVDEQVVIYGMAENQAHTIVNARFLVNDSRCTLNQTTQGIGTHNTTTQANLSCRTIGSKRIILAVQDGKYELQLRRYMTVQQRGCVSSPENCTNGIDDDCDSLIDCNDEDCSTHPSCDIPFCRDMICEGDEDCETCEEDCGACEGCSPSPENCSNEVDDDCDGLIDVDDDDCVVGSSPLLFKGDSSPILFKGGSPALFKYYYTERNQSQNQTGSQVDNQTRGNQSSNQTGNQTGNQTENQAGNGNYFTAEQNIAGVLIRVQSLTQARINESFSPDVPARTIASFKVVNTTNATLELSHSTNFELFKRQPTNQWVLIQMANDPAFTDIYYVHFVSDGEYVLVEKVPDQPKPPETTSPAEESPEGGGSFAWLFVVLIVVLLGGVVFVYRQRIGVFYQEKVAGRVFKQAKRVEEKPVLPGSSEPHVMHRSSTATPKLEVKRMMQSALLEGKNADDAKLELLKKGYDSRIVEKVAEELQREKNKK